MKWLISRLTMKRTNEAGFYDAIGKEMVYYWTDCFGNTFMAVRKFGFRTLK